MNDLQSEFNILLIRYKKAGTYLDDQTIPYAKREQWMPEFEKILDRMNAIIAELNMQGETVDVERVLERGFEE